MSLRYAVIRYYRIWYIHYDMIPYFIIRYHMRRYNMIWYIQYDTIWYDAICYDTIILLLLRYAVMRYYTIGYVQYDVIWYCVVQYETIRYNMVHTIWYDAIYDMYLLHISRSHQFWILHSDWSAVAGSFSIAAFKRGWWKTFYSWSLFPGGLTALYVTIKG